jgi:hypothetical protein
MAENHPLSTRTKLPVIPIIFGAFQLSWLHGYRLAQVVAAPSLALILIGIYWVYAGQPLEVYTSVVWVLLYAMAFTPFAVACHRVLLIGEDSLARYGVMGWTKREFRFLVWLVVSALVGLFVMTIGIMILGGILAKALTFPREDWEGWVGWILITGCGLLGSYITARLSLILPSIALEHRYRISEIWRLSRSNGWRLTVVLAGFPWLLNYLQGLAVPHEVPFFAAVLGSTVYCVFLIVEVAALSLSYKALSLMRT